MPTSLSQANRNRLLQKGRTNDTNALGTLRVWRRHAGEEAAIANLRLAVLRGLPRPLVNFLLRSSSNMGATILSGKDFAVAKSRSQYLTDFPISYVRAAIKDDLPPSAFYPATVAVRDVIRLGREDSPTIALALEAPMLEEEIAAVRQTVGLVGGVALRGHIIAHFSIGSFPGLGEVPAGVFREVEAAAPTNLRFWPVQLDAR